MVVGQVSSGEVMSEDEEEGWVTVESSAVRHITRIGVVAFVAPARAENNDPSG
jgi:hypothetical protein